MGLHLIATSERKQPVMPFRESVINAHWLWANLVTIGNYPPAKARAGHRVIPSLAFGAGLKLIPSLTFEAGRTL
jgi:hypothetical protein